MVNNRNDFSDNISIVVPDSEKDEGYHKRYATSLVSTTQMTSIFYSSATQRWAEYSGVLDVNNYNIISQTSQGDLLPFTPSPLNSIKPVIKNMLGEIMSRPLVVSVTALSTQAIARKSEELLDIDIDFKMKPHAEGMMQATGMMAKSLSLPDTDEELIEYKHNYKEAGEIFYTRLLKDLMIRNRMAKAMGNTSRLSAGDRIRYSLEEAIVIGRTFIQVENIAGNVRFTPINSSTVFWDANSDDLLGGKCSYIGYVEYIPLADAMQQHNFTLDQLNQLRSNVKTAGFMQQGGGFMPFFLIQNRAEYVLKMYVEWKDVKKQVGEINERDNRQIAKIYDAELPKDMSKSKADKIMKERAANGASSLNYEIVRHCTMFGGDIVTSWGIKKNMVRNVDNWQETGFSIKGYIPDWRNGYNLSLFEQVEPIGRVINETWYKMRMALYQDKGVSTMYDISQLPEEYSFEDLDYLGQLLGFTPLSSQKHGVPSSYNQNSVLDRSLQLTRVNAYVTLIRVCQDFIKYILGYNDQRLGAVSASAANGATDMALQASANSTKAFYDGFDSFLCNILSYGLGSLKIVAANNPDKFSDIVGDDGQQYLQKDIEHTLDDYGAYVSIVGADQNKKQLIDETTRFAVQNQMVDWVRGIEMMIEDDPNEAISLIRKFKIEDLRKQKEAKAAQQQEQQAAMQQQQAALQQQQQAVQMTTEQKQQAAMAALQANQALTQMKEQAATQRSLLNNQTALRKQEMADDAALQREIVSGNFALEQTETMSRNKETTKDSD